MGDTYDRLAKAERRLAEVEAERDKQVARGDSFRSMLDAAHARHEEAEERWSKEWDEEKAALKARADRLERDLAQAKDVDTRPLWSELNALGERVLSAVHEYVIPGLFAVRLSPVSQVPIVGSQTPLINLHNNATIFVTPMV